jgi:hypothetical protein
VSGGEVAAIYGLVAVVVAAALGLAGVLRQSRPTEQSVSVTGLTALLDEMRTERADDRATITGLRGDVRECRDRLEELLRKTGEGR